MLEALSVHSLVCRLSSLASTSLSELLVGRARPNRNVGGTTQYAIHDEQFFFQSTAYRARQSPIGSALRCARRSCGPSRDRGADRERWARRLGDQPELDVAHLNATINGLHQDVTSAEALLIDREEIIEDLRAENIELIAALPPSIPPEQVPDARNIGTVTLAAGRDSIDLNSTLSNFGNGAERIQKDTLQFADGVLTSVWGVDVLQLPEGEAAYDVSMIAGDTLDRHGWHRSRSHCLRQPSERCLGGASLRVWIDVDQPESLREAGHPLEVVAARPYVVAADTRPVSDRLTELLERPAQVADPIVALHETCGIRSFRVPDAVLRDEDVWVISVGVRDPIERVEEATGRELSVSTAPRQTRTGHDREPQTGGCGGKACEHGSTGGKIGQVRGGTLDGSCTVQRISVQSHMSMRSAIGCHPSCVTMLTLRKVDLDSLLRRRHTDS